MIKSDILFVIFICIMVAACSKGTGDRPPSQDVFSAHLQYSQYTDPGKYTVLYDDLPSSLSDLCTLIKKQLIHPFDIGKFKDKIPENRQYEDQQFPTVALMLEELLNRNGNGLVMSRQPEDRLIVACVHHSMLLASILRHRGIPVRIRAGYAKYIGNDPRVRVSHVICEVWDAHRQKWILVDPDRQKVDFSTKQFEFSYETWFNIKNNKLPDIQYISRYGNVERSTVHLLCHDLSYIIGNEELYWNDPPIVSHIQTSVDDLMDNELDVLDRLATFLKNPDVHPGELKSIYANTQFLQFRE